MCFTRTIDIVYFLLMCGRGFLVKIQSGVSMEPKLLEKSLKNYKDDANKTTWYLTSATTKSMRACRIFYYLHIFLHNFENILEISSCSERLIVVGPHVQGNIIRIANPKVALFFFSLVNIFQKLS